MPSGFRHAAIVGKYQARGIRPVLEEIAQFLHAQGLEVSFERETAAATGVTDFEALTPEQMGARCDIAVVVGGDGTMLGIARELAPYNVPLVGINQGRLGFVTDIPVDKVKEALAPIVGGDYERKIPVSSDDEIGQFESLFDQFRQVFVSVAKKVETPSETPPEKP